MHIVFSEAPDNGISIGVDAGSERLLPTNVWNGVSTYIRSREAGSDQVTICVEVARGANRFFCDAILIALEETTHEHSASHGVDGSYICCFSTSVGKHIIVELDKKAVITSASFSLEKYHGDISHDVAFSSSHDDSHTMTGCCRGCTIS